MKILVVCDQGNNRSVTLAGQLKYLGNDVLTCGLSTNDPHTIAMLVKWADIVIGVDDVTMNSLRAYTDFKANLWDMGPDEHPRPYNPEMLRIAKELIRGHPGVDNRDKNQSK